MSYPSQNHQAGRRRRSSAAALFVIITVLVITAPTARSDSALTPTPTLDRLATPVMPEHPTAADLGRQVYYLNCMPCHGDVGQGLTDEWRAVWVDDHQNCWAKGCHGGRQQDEGFPLPKTIPAVIGSAATTTHYTTSADLITYLEQTHPPQRPGKLPPQDYENVAAFLWQANHGDAAAGPPWAVIGGIGVLVVVGLLVGLYRKRRMRTRHEA